MNKEINIEELNEKYNFMCDFWESGHYAVKSNISVIGKRLHCCSEVLSEYVSSFDATVVKRLREKSFIPSFSTNMDEFAMGAFGGSFMFGPTHNVNNPSLWASGGSSGGSAVAVALDIVPFALGSDTGGSVRLPAAHNGICSFKPSYGAISRFGLVLYSSSMDTIGIFSKSITKIEEIFNIIRGPDNNDMQTFAITLQPKRENNALVYLDYYLLTDICSKEILQQYISFTKFLSLHFGARPISEIIGKEEEALLFDHIIKAGNYYYDIACMEAFSNLKRFNGLRYMENEKNKYTNLMQISKEKLSENVQTRIKRGENFMSKQLDSGVIDKNIVDVKEKRNSFIQFMKYIFKKVNFLILPTNNSEPFELSNKECFTILEDTFLCFSNLAGLCATTIPVSKYIGVQIVGSSGDDDNCLDISKQIQQKYEKNII